MEHTEGNLTVGPIAHVLATLSLPIITAAFLSTAYNITDMAWIGKLGGNALAGVGVGGMYSWLSQGLSTLARMGGQVLVAQELGKGRKEYASAYAVASIQLTVLFGVIFGAFCLIFTDPLIGFFGLKNAEALRDAKIYMQITCGLILFSYLGQTLTGLYTAQGDSKSPLKANFIGLVANMILDPLLILGIGPVPKLGAAGAAIATVAAQIIVVVVLMIKGDSEAAERRVLGHRRAWERQESRYIRGVLKMGAPSALQGTIYPMISMVISRMAGNFGDAAFAVLRVGGQIESLTWNIANGFASAMNAFAAQNYGAGKMKRVKEGYRISLIIVAVWAGFISLLFIFVPKPISSVFFHTDEEIRLSAQYLIVIGVGEIFMCVELMSEGAISGLGNTKICSAISIIFTAIRIPLAMVLSRTSLGVDGLWWALTISSIIKGILFVLTFYKECRKKENGLLL